MLHRPIARVRERMVLGQVRPMLEADERIAVWTHVHAPEDERPGLLSLTTDRCLVHFSARGEASAAFHWHELTAWELAPRDHGATVLRLVAGNQHVEVQLALTTDARARTATSVVEHVARYAPGGATSATPRADGLGELDEVGEDVPIRFVAEPRGLRGHARRVGVTIAGVLVIVLSAVFASPFVPGPGALTFLAGLAILAREYDWARDVHHWFKRKVDQVWRWIQTRREERRRRRAIREATLHELTSRQATPEPGIGSGGEPGIDPIRKALNE